MAETQHDRPVVLVTGGSRGIGAAVCRLAAARGYAVAVNYTANRPAADRVVADIAAAGGRAVAVAGDVSREDDVARLFDRTAEHLGPLDALVSNAGITGSWYGRLDGLPPGVLRRVVEVNVIGAVLCAREAVRRMSTRHGGRGGSIVTVSSRAAVLGSAGEWVHYAASKGAVDTLTVGLSREVAADGIRVNAVSPGLVDTDMQLIPQRPDRLTALLPTIPMGRAGGPAEVAEAVLWLLSDAASFVTGAVLPVSGGR